MTAETAVKVRRAIIKSANISPKIKWVNDLYVGERKLCGILCEGIFDDNGAIRFIAIGIGVNVYSRCFSKEISDIATSIEDSGGAPISRNKIIAAIIEEMLCESDPLELLCEYRSSSMLIDRDVTVLSPAQPPYISRVIGISDDYRLIVEHNGKTEFLFSGEVSLKLK